MTDVKLNYILACDQVIIDENGKPSFIGVFNKINTKNTPAIHPRFTIATNTTGKLGISFLEKIEIINLNDNNPIASVEAEVKFKEAGMNNFFGNFLNTLFPTFGKYWIKVSIDGTPITNSNEHYVLVEKNP